VLGAGAGAALTGHRGARAAVRGAAAGAAFLGAAEAVSRGRQRPGQIPELWSRILASGALAAPAGWAGGRLSGTGPLTVGAVSGAVAGGLGLRPQYQLTLAVMAAIDGDYRRYYEGVRDAILGAAPSPVSPAEAIAVMAVIAAGEESVALGRSMPLPLTEAEVRAYGATKKR